MIFMSTSHHPARTFDGHDKIFDSADIAGVVPLSSAAKVADTARSISGSGELAFRSAEIDRKIKPTPMIDKATRRNNVHFGGKR